MRQKQKTTPRFIFEIYIYIHAINGSGKRKTKQKDFFFIFTLNNFGLYTTAGDIVQKEMLKYYVLSFKHDLFSLPSFRSALRFCLWQMEVHTQVCLRYNHSLDKERLDIKRILIGHSRGHTVTFFFPLTKIDTAYPALKFLLNIYKIMSRLFTVR